MPSGLGRLHLPFPLLPPVIDMTRSAPVPLIALLVLSACADPAPEEGSAPGDVVATPSTDAPVAPDFDIWLAPLDESGSGIEIGVARNVTDRAGYDNQPSFLADGSLLYTRQEGERTDIWRYDPETGERSAVAETDPESEYSALRLPIGNGISVVRVEADSTQRLWRLPLEGGEASVIFPDVAPVGYHAWADDASAFLFVLGQPATLHQARVGEAGTTLRAENIGRSIQKVPGRRAISYVQRADEGTTEIRVWDLDAEASTLVVNGVDGADDHAWTPSGTLLQGSGDRLYAFRNGADGWTEIARAPEGGEISRLAVSPDGTSLAMVVASGGG